MKTIVKFIIVSMALWSLGACDRQPEAPVAAPRTQRVTGFITEIEAGTMSLRTTDDSKQFIFSLENSPVALEHLQQHMDQRLPVKVEYRIEASRLIPITIEDT